MRNQTLSWIASLLAGGLLAAGVTFPWAPREEFDPAAIIAYVVNKISQAHVSPIEPRKLTEQTLVALTESLDPWSAYISPTDYADFDEEAEGRFGGIGITFEHRDARYFIGVVLSGGPADRAGLVSGVELLRAGADDLPGRKEEEIRRLLRGYPGTVLSLAVRFPDGVERTVALERETIRDPSVYRVGLLSDAPKIGHVRIERFQRETRQELDKAVHALLRARIEGLVIDLRENPGGLYDEAVAIADRFIERGVLVSTKGRDDPAAIPFAATAEEKYPPLRIAIVVNERTASAAEIVAAALREHRKAILVGHPTFGKFSVQSVYELFHNGAVWGALKLTTKQYFTPAGHSFTDGGMPIDVSVDQDDQALVELRRGWNKDLRGSWSDPTRLAEGILGTGDDPCLARALGIVADARRYEELLAKEPTPPPRKETGRTDRDR